MNETSRIKVVQYRWGGENTAYSLGIRINETYCRRHGYHHVVLSHPPREDRSRHWEKIRAIRNELHDCDFLLYLDADAFFYSHELKIEEEILPHLENREIMMAADYACEGLRHQPDKPNSGVILVRNSDKANEIMRVWDESSERSELAEFRFRLYHDQEACHRSVWQEYPDEVKLLKEYYLMNGFGGMFIRHLMGLRNERRVRMMEKYLAEHGNETTPKSRPERIVKTSESGRKRQWGIAVMTTTRRTDAVLSRSLESFRHTGFEPPVVFTDLDRKGGLWNLHRSLKSLLEKYPKADAYAIVEDDLLFSRDIRDYLESELWPSVGEYGCICSIFTPTIYGSRERWHTENRGKRTWMSQFRIYHPVTARKFVADLENDSRIQNRGRQNDYVVGEWAEKNKVDIWFHTPSLVQHIAGKTTSYGLNKSVNYRLGMARDFIGENCSIREYFERWGYEPRPIRVLPKLEIHPDGTGISGGDRDMEFTPETARTLAEKINDYNCDVLEINFVGKNLHRWQYLGRCVHILRMTGKI